MKISRSPRPRPPRGPVQWPVPAWSWHTSRHASQPAVPFATQRPVLDEFIKGSLTTGLLAAMQHGNGQPLLDRRTLRLALQGGAALAAGTAAVQAIRQARHGQALLAVAGGALAVAAAEHFLKPDAMRLQEDHDGTQEEEQA